MCKRTLLLSYIFSAYLFLPVATEAAPPAVRHDTNDTNLVALWHLDETGGTVAVDSKGGDNNGTLSATFNTYSWGASGKFGTALTMGTSNTIMDARVTFPLTGMTATAGSVAMWAKLETQPPLATSAFRYFTGWKGTTVVNGSTADRVQFWMCNVPSDPDLTTELCAGLGDQNKLDTFIKHLNVGEWYHLALTWKQTDVAIGSGNYQVYVNGIDMPSGLMAAGYTPGCYKNLRGMAVNGQFFNNQPFAGSPALNEGGAETLDEVGFYNDVLTRAEVCTLAGADPNKAWNPTPDDGYINQPVIPILSWSAGAGAASHDVYFGTNSASPVFKGNQMATTYSAGTLVFNKTYYWRIDEKNDSNSLTATGDLWRFTTVTAKASDPAPYNGRYNVRIPVTLAWKAGDTSNICHDVYFGTNFVDVSGSDRSGPAFVAKEQAIGTTTYTPNGILLDKRYYWRIDEVISYPTLTKGDIWTFTSSPIFYADDFQAFVNIVALKNAWKATGTGNNSWVYQNVSGTDKTVCFWYDNATSPYYAGIKRSVPGAQGTSRDYTFGGSGASVRVSYVVGPNNPALYVSLFNGATSSTRVKQPINTMTPQPPSPPLPSSYTWKDVWFNLSDFSNSVTTNVTAIEIGDGNRAAPLGGQGFIYFDDVRILATEPCPPIDGDINYDCTVDYKDVDVLHDDWLKVSSNLVKNSGINQGPWGSIPSNQPNGGSDPCSVNWPKYWYLWNNTSTSQDANYVLSIDKSDPGTKTCARLDLDGPTTMWNDGALCQTIDACDYSHKDLMVSFMHKGDITGQDNTMFEYRTTIDSCATNYVGGPPILKRVQRGGQTICGDCYGALSWDWEPYTHIVSVNVLEGKRYLHLHFRLCGRQDSSANPPQYLKITNVTALKNGDVIPAGDIDLDNEVNFRDYAILADNWLVTQQTIP